MGQGLPTDRFTYAYDSEARDLGRAFLGMVRCFEAITPYSSNDIQMRNGEPQTSDRLIESGVFFATDLRDFATLNLKPRFPLSYYLNVDFSKTLPTSIGFLPSTYDNPEPGHPSQLGQIIFLYKNLEPQVFTVVATKLSPQRNNPRATAQGTLLKVGFTTSDPETKKAVDALMGSEEGIVVLHVVPYKEKSVSEGRRRTLRGIIEERGGRQGKVAKANNSDGIHPDTEE